MLCLQRPSVPVFQNIRYPTPTAAKAAARGQLAIAQCTRCGFVFNAAFDPGLAVYSADYENEQALSDRFRVYLDGIAARVLAGIGAEPQPVVLEIGCGQASFLKQLARVPAARFSRFLGFDPAWRGGDIPQGVDVRPHVFDTTVAAELGTSLDAVISRHVIEHVAQPVQFLQDIRRAIGASPRPTLMLETPCLEWIVEHGVLFDFFYEHCCYFTIDTLGYALRRAGYRVIGIEHVFDGQYLWAQAEPDAGPVDAIVPPPLRGLGELIRRIGERGEAQLAAWRQALVGHGKQGRVALWGAGAKGATLAALLDPAGALIDCLVDINPRKQGGFIAVTGHPIVSPDDAAGRGVRVVLPVNPNYRDEIRRLIRDRGLGFSVEEI